MKPESSSHYISIHSAADSLWVRTIQVYRSATPFHTHTYKSYKRPTTDAKKFVTRKKYVFYLSPLFCCYYKSVYCKNEIYKNTMYIVNTHSCRLSSIIISSERNFWISHEMEKSLDVVTVATRHFYEPCILRRKVS
jgi:hypothetical protein